MTEIKDKRIRFTKNIAKLILWIIGQGCQVVFDKDGQAHMKRSLHYEGLAKDLLIYDRDGKYMKKSEDYAFAGSYWKSLDPENCWGGDFPGDGNHFSITYQGRK
jgi:hypothetical protein